MKLFSLGSYRASRFIERLRRQGAVNDLQAEAMHYLREAYFFKDQHSAKELVDSAKLDSIMLYLSPRTAIVKGDFSKKAIDYLLTSEGRDLTSQTIAHFNFF